MPVLSSLNESNGNYRQHPQVVLHLLRIIERMDRRVGDLQSAR
jgi:hypothetical protein